MDSPPNSGSFFIPAFFVPLLGLTPAEGVGFQLCFAHFGGFISIYLPISGPKGRGGSQADVPTHQTYPISSFIHFVPFPSNTSSMLVAPVKESLLQNDFHQRRCFVRLVFSDRTRGWSNSFICACAASCVFVLIHSFILIMSPRNTKPWHRDDHYHDASNQEDDYDLWTCSRTGGTFGSGAVA